MDGPGFDTVLDWRLQQEATNTGVTLSQLPQERREWVASFVQYFERLTQSMHAGYRSSGAVLRVDENRNLLTP